MHIMKILLLGGLLLLDQLTKYWAFSVLSGKTVGMDFFQLVFVKNTGIAFSFPVPLWIIIASAGGVIAFLLWKWVKGVFEWPYALVGIGALGNLIDRVLHGYVVDFISIGKFPVFNFADIYISVGIGLLLISEYKRKK